ncbi:RNA degradosome polyphosphate kinase [Egicoccus halophilus]|uniref:Polyphosphate kinase n=1 Tax=Egicoccus halophilus TaxID=1670830 RepID=A0A8J3ET67_9ACTN|nr:RNA degradosome polyphosphate kinase [Egicoccus halophilus]GGI08893.1 polyphosphate kinase [Egicoccus halophilus]
MTDARRRGNPRVAPALAPPGTDLGDPEPAKPRAPAIVPGTVPADWVRTRERTVSILDFHPQGADGQVRHLNRELSWLQFDERVLALAENPGVPLLERAKFLAIFTSNLDEFFQVRVAGLKEQVAAGVTGSGADGIPPADQLLVIDALASEFSTRAARLFRDELVPALDAHGIRFSNWDTLDDEDRDHLVQVFDETIFPVLTPLAVDPAHPFPYLSNLSLNLAVVVRDPDDGERRFARIKVPPVLPRFVVLPDGERFVPLEQVIAAHLPRLFAGLEIVEHHVFRVTRNADFEVEEDEADDLLLAIETELTRRRFGSLVRLEVEPEMSASVLELLLRELEITDDEVILLPGPLDLSGLWALYELDRPDLKYAPMVTVTQPRLTTAMTGDHQGLFATLREGDVLVQHPYDSFTTSVRAFLEAAATDPQVLAIKITLYRTSGRNSPITQALLDAAAEGKQVVALVELKARFDEEANIAWARVLEEAGVHVAYGVVGLKTHTKICLVVRDDGDRVRRYAHIGTGNYNDKTARIYEDVGLLTADPDIGADLSDLFNVLTGYSRQADFRKLLIAPTTFRRRMLELIDRERDAEDGHVLAKMNSLVDPRIIEGLYAASQAGTPVDLIVRGVCCLRPGVPGLSDNIRVRSVVGQFLEHSRIYRFGSPARGFDYVIGSGDWMPRNLDRRVEALVPIEDPGLQARLEEILQVALHDDLLAWELRPDSTWVPVEAHVGLDTHQTLRERARQRLR